MEGYSDFFRDKKITMLGLGLLGRAVGDAEFLAESGAQILVTDKKSEKELAESVDRLKKYPNVMLRLGGHSAKDFTDADMVIKAAGVPLDSPEIAAARSAGMPVYMSTALFAKFAMDVGARVVGVTGTRGKSTIVHMIYHCLKRLEGLNRSEGSVGPRATETLGLGRTTLPRKVVLGGNIRGVSTLAMLPSIEAGDVAVLELDSWQLQGFGDLTISPDIAIFSNLMPDHLNYYPDMESYFADKANIFRFQRDGDVLICGAEIAERICDAKPPVAPTSAVPLPEDWNLKILGAHNRENAALAAAALKAAGLSESEIREGIESFDGVQGRLQFVREVSGVKIYNDNNATTPEATIAALKALDTGSLNIVLIAGGADKGLDLPALVGQMKKSCKKVVFLSGSGTDRLSKWYNGTVFSNMRLALREALALAGEGDIVLFSPGFASFGMFKNEYDRNDQFLNLVRAL